MLWHVLKMVLLWLYWLKFARIRSCLWSDYWSLWWSTNAGCRENYWSTWCSWSSSRGGPVWSNRRSHYTGMRDVDRHRPYLSKSNLSLNCNKFIGYRNLCSNSVSIVHPFLERFEHFSMSNHSIFRKIKTQNYSKTSLYFNNEAMVHKEDTSDTSFVRSLVYGL